MAGTPNCLPCGVLMQPTEAAATDEATHIKIRRKVMGGIRSKTGSSVKPIAQFVDKSSERLCQDSMNISAGHSVEVIFMSILRRNWEIGAAVGFALYLTALAQADDSPRRDTVVKAAERVMPSVVNIVTKTRAQRVRYYYDWWRDNWAPYAQELPPEESSQGGDTPHGGGSTSAAGRQAP